MCLRFNYISYNAFMSSRVRINVSENFEELVSGQDFLEWMTNNTIEMIGIKYHEHVQHTNTFNGNDIHVHVYQNMRIYLHVYVHVMNLKIFIAYALS